MHTTESTLPLPAPQRSIRLSGGGFGKIADLEELAEKLKQLDRLFFIAEKNGGWYLGEECAFSETGEYRLAAMAAPSCPQSLGDGSFRREYGLRYPLIGGSMAYGISSALMAEKMAESGMMSFVGTGGMAPRQVEENILRLEKSIGAAPYGFNLIHSPQSPALESTLVDLYLKHQMHLIEASAYINLTPPLIRFRAKGLRRNADGSVGGVNKIIAKASRLEVAERFLSPAPAGILQDLVDRGELTAEEAALAAEVPVACDITAEADSGGHTDNRPALALFPSFDALKSRLAQRYTVPLRIGLGGGIGTPRAAAAAFAMGAAYIVTGSVNQACIESGTSDLAREMLLKAGPADMAMAPSADMFEIGAKVQALKNGTMFPMRAQKLAQLYQTYAGLDEIPAAQRTMLEQSLFRDSLENIWRETCRFFSDRDPQQIERAEKNPKYKMALLFRFYLGQSPRWAIAGDASRKMDFQIWTGPAIGAFNEWTKGTFLGQPENRKVASVSMNLLYGAALLARLEDLRRQGLDLFDFIPVEPQENIPVYP